MLIVAATGFQPSAFEILIDSACESRQSLEALVRITKFLPRGAYVGLLPETAVQTNEKRLETPQRFNIVMV